MHKFEQMCTSTRVHIANEKTKGPSTVITFLGVEFDTINMELRLPADKPQKLQLQLDHIHVLSSILIRVSQFHM